MTPSRASTGSRFITVCLVGMLCWSIGSPDVYAGCSWRNPGGCVKKAANKVKNAANKAVDSARDLSIDDVTKGAGTLAGNTAVAPIELSGKAIDKLGDMARNQDKLGVVGDALGKVGDVGGAVGKAADTVGDKVIAPAVDAAVRLPLDAVIAQKALVLAAWIRASRDNLLREGVQPIPPQIADTIRKVMPDFPEGVLRKVRHRVGTGGALSVAGVTQTFGDAAATTLDYVVVFKKPMCTQHGLYSPVEDAATWAHELRHVLQYESWGITEFAFRYLKNWDGVEDTAYSFEKYFANTAKNRGIQTYVDFNKSGSCPTGVQAQQAGLLRPRGIPDESATAPAPADERDENLTAMQAEWIGAELSARDDVEIAAEPSSVQSRDIPMSPDSSSAPAHSVVVERPLHVLASTGRSIPVSPGRYLVGYTPSRRVRLYTPDNRLSLELQTTAGVHEENIATPVADLTADDDNPDVQYIMLLLPNRTMLLAAGTYSGRHP